MTMQDATDPYALFNHWFEAARLSEPSDPNAMSLATATPEGAPSVRIVLLKRVDARGFSFYTNGDSRKGAELRANPRAALGFHWKSIHRQVRIEGPVAELPPEDADDYFAHRPRMSQIGAWASRQSRPLSSRDELLDLARKYEEQFPNQVPRPPYWTGFVLTPLCIEFWQAADYRLHDRFVFHLTPPATWTKQRLFP